MKIERYIYHHFDHGILLFVFCSLLIIIKRVYIEYNHHMHGHCSGENFVYNITYEKRIDGKMEKQVIMGKKFDCKLLPYLKRLKLTDKQNFPEHESMMGRIPEDVVFLTATDHRFFNSVVDFIDSIQTIFENRHKKIIVYDLGGISKNSTMVNRIKDGCRVELRKFNFNLIPESVHNPRFYTWKLYIMAETLKKYKTVIYCDTSIFFIDSDFRDFVQLVNAGRLMPIQYVRDCPHGTKFTTHPKMLTYLPLHPEYDESDVQMQQANLMILHRSKYTTQILKWAILCAMTKGCIEPEFERIRYCRVEQFGLIPHGKCNLEDQSASNILIHNAERRLKENGMTKLITHTSFYHPGKLRERNYVLRFQNTVDTIKPTNNCHIITGNNSHDNHYLRANILSRQNIYTCKRVDLASGLAIGSWENLQNGVSLAYLRALDYDNN